MEPKPEKPVDPLIEQISTFNRQKDEFDNKVGNIKSLVAKKDATIDKLVNFHKTEIARIKAEKDAEIAKLRDAIKEALINDHE